LSYLIQNFSHPHHSLRMNVRNRSALLARNTSVICFLLSNASRASSLISRTGANLQGLIGLRNEAFKYFSNSLLIKSKYLKYTPIGVNFPVSAYYQTLLQIDQHLDKKSSPSPLLPLTVRSVTYPYFAGLPIAITPISKKPFSYTLYKFLRMSMSVWFYWPRKYGTDIHYTDIQGQWYLLRFLNSYYFRVYNI